MDIMEEGLTGRKACTHERTWSLPFFPPYNPINAAAGRA